MIIDLHFHTKQYSACSQIDMEEGIRYAKEIGLDGLCITDHDVFADKKEAKRLSEKYNILIIVGTEINTIEGDILCFGLDEIPRSSIHAQDLLDYVNAKGGAAIAAHPFRDNNRGLKDFLFKLNGLHAIECLNGNTHDEHNDDAREAAKILNLPCTGSSDAHRIEKIGYYATEFNEQILSEQDLVTALRRGEFSAVHFHQ